MGLEQVIGDVRRDGDARAQEILDNARAEADKIIAAAKEKANAYEQARKDAAAKDAEQLQAQISSSAEFAARKHLLTTEAELRKDLHQVILDGFGGLKPATRKVHVDALVKKAQAMIPSGTVSGTQADQEFLAAQDVYTVGAPIQALGGIIVESEDGANRVDLTYETLIADMWRDILKMEAGLFE